MTRIISPNLRNRLLTRAGRFHGAGTSAAEWTSPFEDREVPSSETGTSEVRLADSSTAIPQPTEEVEQVIAALCANARAEPFEDGMLSEFAAGLISAVQRYHEEAMVELADKIVYRRICPEVAGEALRWLGRLDDPSTYRYRRWLLEWSLKASSAAIRDAALLGLAAMNDPHSIPYLRGALEIEQVSELRRDIEAVLTDLETDSTCHSS